MIKKEELLEAAKFKRLSPKFAELDYIQDIALTSISHEFGNKLVFKGGTCLYKLFQLNRFSEDLDFTAVKGFKQRNFFQRFPYFFSLFGMKANCRIEEFQNTTNVYITVNGPLYDGKKESQTTLMLNISHRELVILPIERFYYIPFYRELRTFDLFAMDGREILAEKIRSVYSRNKARDVFDIWFLLKQRKVSLDVGLANKKLSVYNLKFDGKNFMDKLEQKKTSWGRDLSALISGELPQFQKVKEEIMEVMPTNKTI